MYHLHVWCLRRPEKGIGYLGSSVTMLGPNSGSLKEQDSALNWWAIFPCPSLWFKGPVCFRLSLCAPDFLQLPYTSLHSLPSDLCPYIFRQISAHTRTHHCSFRLCFRFIICIWNPNLHLWGGGATNCSIITTCHTARNHTGGSSLLVQGPRISTAELSQLKQNEYFFPSFCYKLISMPPTSKFLMSKLSPQHYWAVRLCRYRPYDWIPLCKNTSITASSRHGLNTAVVAWSRPAHD